MAYTLIASGDAANTDLNITNIPQTHKTLVLDFTLSQSNAGSFGMRVNNNTNSVYNFLVNNTWGTSRGTDSSSVTLASNMPSGVYTRFIITIPNYNGTGFHAWNWVFMSANGNGGLGTGSFGENAAITELNVAPSGSGTYSYDLWGLS